MQKEYVVNINMDMDQEGANRFIRAMERHYLEADLVLRSKNVDESWASLSFHTDKPLQNINNLTNYLYNNANKMNIRVSTDVQIHTPQILVGLSQVDANPKIFEGLNVSRGQKDAEITFISTKQREEFLKFLKNENIDAVSYFTDVELEAKNNYSSSKKLGM